MNIFSILLKPFISTNRQQENIDFEEEPKSADSAPPNADLRPVMFISPSPAPTTTISLPSFIKTPSIISNNSTDNFSPIGQAYQPFSVSTPTKLDAENGGTKIRKSSTSSTTSSTTSSGMIWPFGKQHRHIEKCGNDASNNGSIGAIFRNSDRACRKIMPEENATNFVKNQLSSIKEVSEQQSQTSNMILSRQNSPIPPIIHPYQMLLDTLHVDPEENIDDYDFHCKNISENLKPYIKKHNHLVDDIQNVNTYSDIIETNHLRSISCPNITSNVWKPPSRHGIQNSARIIPNYYFQTHQNIQKLCSDKSALLEIDYLFMIKDDIRNMRKLNQYQIDYIQTLDDTAKNEIICEFHKASNAMIETISMMRSRESSPDSSSKDLLLRAAEALESESYSDIRKHMPRTSTI